MARARSTQTATRPMARTKVRQEQERPAVVVTIERKVTRQPAGRKNTRPNSRGR